MCYDVMLRTSLLSVAQQEPDIPTVDSRRLPLPSIQSRRYRNGQVSLPRLRDPRSVTVGTLHQVVGAPVPLR
jgi:hypothetical protein